MKQIRRTFLLFLVLLFLCAFLPMMTPATSAVATPTLVLKSSTATNPILDHPLDFETYHSGGPFTVTFEWRACQLQPLGNDDPYATVLVYGAVFGSTTNQQADPGLTITGSTGWQTRSFTFQNVGTYSISGVNLPGNFLRFALWQSSGELRIRNLVIQNAAGEILYDLNTDPTIQQALSITQNVGMYQCDISVLSEVNYENCPWLAGQFGTGSYTASVLSMDADPISVTTGKQTSTTTRLTSTSRPIATGTVTRPTTCVYITDHTFQDGFCIYCGLAHPGPVYCELGLHVYLHGYCLYCAQPISDPCANSHTYQNGFCVNCAASDPNYDPCANGHTYRSGYCIYCLDREGGPFLTTIYPTTTPTTLPASCVDGHVFYNGFCMKCNQPDPDFTRPPTTGLPQPTGTTYPGTTGAPTTKPTNATSQLCIGRPTAQPTGQAYVTQQTLAEDSNMVMNQPVSTQTAPTSSSTQIASSSAPSDTPDEPTDPTFIIVIAVVTVLALGCIITIVLLKKK